MRPTAPLLLLAIAGCTPQNAKITSGSFTVALSQSTSLVVREGKQKIGETGDYVKIDCRDIDEDRKLEGADPTICDAKDDEDFDLWPITHEGWANYDGYHMWEMPLEPWRGEAILTMEDDLQLAFHQRIPGGDDFRFTVTVDPNFQPVRCEQDSAGNLAFQPIDGNWLANWSEDAASDDWVGTTKGGTLFYLNAGAYQFNPDKFGEEDRELWSLPVEWRAGYGRAKYGPTEFFTRKPRYGMPSVYAAYELDGVEPSQSDLFYSGMQAGDDPSTNTSHQNQIARVGEVADLSRQQFEALHFDTLPPAVHTNEWRAPDGLASGLDSWVELHYTWIRIDQDIEDIVAGNPVTGEFNIMFDASESQDRLVVHATFEVDKIKRDRWTTDRVDLDKLRENGTVLCGVDYGEQ